MPSHIEQEVSPFEPLSQASNKLLPYSFGEKHSASALSVLRRMIWANVYWATYKSHHPALSSDAVHIPCGVNWAFPQWSRTGVAMGTWQVIISRNSALQACKP